MSFSLRLPPRLCVSAVAFEMLIGAGGERSSGPNACEAGRTHGLLLVSRPRPFWREVGAKKGNALWKF